MRIPVIIALVASIIIAACTTSIPSPTEDRTVIYTTYGGFVPVEMAVGVTTIDGRDVTIERFDNEGRRTASVTFRTSAEKAQALQDAIDASSYPDLPDRVPEPEQVMVADVGSANLTIDGETSVLELNYAPQLPAEVAAIVDAIHAITQDMPETNVPMYFAPNPCTPPAWYPDGADDVSGVVDMLMAEGIDVGRVAFNEREGMVCEACSADCARSVVTAWVSADARAELENLGWLNQAPFGNDANEDATQLAFEPMQCESTPWDEWYAEGNINYVTAPTPEQLIADYYSQVHDITVESVVQHEREGAVCQACNVCPQGTYYVATVASSDAEALETLGWGSVPAVGSDLVVETRLHGHFTMPDRAVEITLITQDTTTITTMRTDGTVTDEQRFDTPSILWTQLVTTARDVELRDVDQDPNGPQVADAGFTDVTISDASGERTATIDNGAFDPPEDIGTLMETIDAIRQAGSSDPDDPVDSGSA